MVVCGLRTQTGSQSWTWSSVTCFAVASKHFAADSAADEQLTARELQGGLLAGPAVPRLQEELTQFLSSLKAWFFFCMFSSLFCAAC